MRLSRFHAISMTLATAALIYGCAQSEPLDINVLVPDGGSTGGVTGTGSGGDSSSTGGTIGTGDGGTGDIGSGGATGNGGTVGTGGSGSGSGGLTGTGGFTGTGGVTGSGGAVGTGGSASGGATGSGGRGGSGGTGGATGKGGTTGTGGAIGTGGATGTGGVAGTGGAGGMAGTAPTFTQIYTQILTVYCAGTKCHDPGTQHGVSFSTQAGAYTSVAKLVTPGNGANSSFYKTVNGGSMPPGGPKLSAANLALIKAWIDAGALNN